MNLANDPWFLKKLVKSLVGEIVANEMEGFINADDEDDPEYKKAIAEKLEASADLIANDIGIDKIPCIVGGESAVKMSRAWYELKLGESFDLNNFIKISRVPGGWMWTEPSVAVMIPYTEEFEILKYYKIPT